METAWLLWANDTATRYAAIHCPSTGNWTRSMQRACRYPHTRTLTDFTPLTTLGKPLIITRPADSIGGWVGMGTRYYDIISSIICVVRNHRKKQNFVITSAKIQKIWVQSVFDRWICLITLQLLGFDTSMRLPFRLLLHYICYDSLTLSTISICIIIIVYIRCLSVKNCEMVAKCMTIYLRIKSYNL